jgi:hypothetical protein
VRILDDGIHRIEVIYNGKGYAIDPVTFEYKIGNIKNQEPTETSSNTKKPILSLVRDMSGNTRMVEKKKPTYEEILAHNGGA